MTNSDPQTTGDFWDAYLRAAGAGTNLSQVNRTFLDAPQELMPRTAPAPITFAWDLVVLRGPLAPDAHPSAA